MDESVEDITAALMAPRPKKATQVGVRYCRHRGKTKLVSATSLFADGAGPKKEIFYMFWPHDWDILEKTACCPFFQ